MQISKKKKKTQEKNGQIYKRKKIYIYISKYMAKIHIHLPLVHLITTTM